ncbi:hypothetical protein VKT23_020209 [Stygiomarasmius scandens]|uniref:Uncharacterized protein n=1 Tax=Marasmiellus scandens TaxID=2682957 RepID=A0ABR1ILJ9_9AGAR
MDVASLVNSNPSGSGTEKEDQWGRVLICGGTDCGCHFVVIDAGFSSSSPLLPSSNSDTGNSAWLFGCNGNSCLGVAGGFVCEEGTRFVDAACGRNHTLLVGSDGQVWSAGANSLGQCGNYPCSEITNFKLIQGLQHDGVPERAVKVSAGITFSLVLTKSGKVFSLGSAEKGQLGNGSTGECITTGNKTAFDIVYEPWYIKELNFPPSDGGRDPETREGSKDLKEGGKKIRMIAISSRYGDTMATVVSVSGTKLIYRKFTPPQSCAIAVAAGPSNTVVIDKQGCTGWQASGIIAGMAHQGVHT